MQFSVAVRNGMLDSIETTIGPNPLFRLYSGAMPSDCAQARTGTKLAEFTLASDWAPVASAGQKSINLPSSVTGIAGGVVGYYSVMDSAGTTCHEQGTVTLAGGGGDAIADNLNVGVGQTLNITGATKVAPNP